MNTSLILQNFVTDRLAGLKGLLKLTFGTLFLNNAKEIAAGVFYLA